MRIVGGVVLGTLLALAACGAAWRHGDRGHRGWSQRHAYAALGRALDRVEATEEQRTKARQILGRTLTELEPWRDAGRRLQDELHAAWTAEQPEAAALHARVDAEIEALRALAHGVLDDGIALHDVLTSEQRARLARHHRWRGRSARLVE